jgi:hypothetical protein
MDYDEGSSEGRREAAHDQPAEERERGPGGDYGSSDLAGLLGNPTTGEEPGRVRLRCPEPGCDQTGSAADYRQAYWPRCQRHHARMVRVEAG